MTKYAAGTVAVATVRGVPNVRVMLAVPGSAMPWIGNADDGRGTYWHTDQQVTDVRPLVVLDLAAPAYGGAARVVEALRRCPTRDSVSLALADQIEAQTKPPAPRFPLGAKVRFNGEITSSDAWAKRRDERHLGIVVDHFSHNDVRVYDTVEHDWWQCDEGRLAAVEDES